MDLTMSKTERHASAPPQLLIVMVERKAAPIDSGRFQPDLVVVLQRHFGGTIAQVPLLGVSVNDFTSQQWLRQIP